jgi:hypothetical protein
MALLDDPRVAPVAQACQDELSRIAQETDVRMTPFAEEIVTLFVTSAVFEPATAPGWQFVSRPENEALYGTLMGSLRPIFEDVVSTSSVRLREGETHNVLMTADVYHWLSERSRDVLASLPCPYDK